MRFASAVGRHTLLLYFTPKRRKQSSSASHRAYRQQRFADILPVGRKLDKELVEVSTKIFDFVDIADAKVER